MTVAASSGATTIARAAMVRPSSTYTDNTCAEDEPRLLRSTISPRCCSTTNDDRVMT